MIGGGAPLRLSSGGQPGCDRGVDPATRLHMLSMKCLLVTLQRPWLNHMLFEIGGWRLPEQPRGFCSSGALDENGGVIPLLPTAVLLATDVGLDATWSKADREFIEREGKSPGSVSLGPFPLGPSASTSSLQAVAWINALTPFFARGCGIVPGLLGGGRKSPFEKYRCCRSHSGGFVNSSRCAEVAAGAARCKSTIERSQFRDPLSQTGRLLFSSEQTSDQSIFGMTGILPELHPSYATMPRP